MLIEAGQEEEKEALEAEEEEAPERETNMDFTDKTCIVTGANTGLGFEVAKRLGGLGADTTLLCMSERKGEEAVLRIQTVH